MQERRIYTRFIRFTSISAVIFGMVVFLFGLALLYQMLQISDFGNMPIAFDAAVCFALAGIALYLSSVSLHRKYEHYLAAVLSVLIVVVGLHAILDEFPSLGISPVMEMSVQTAVCFILFGVAIFFICSQKLNIISQWLLHLVTVISFVALIGHMLHVPGLYTFSAFTAMALYTAIAFIFLSVAASLVNPALGITGIFTGKLIGHLMARRLFFAMLIAILAVAYLRFLGHTHKMVSWEMGLALMVMAFCTITFVLIWIVANILNKAYVKVKSAEESLSHVVEAAPFAVLVADYNGNIIRANRKAELIYGYEENDLLSTPLRQLIPKELHGNYAEQRSDFFENNTVVSFGEDKELTAVRKNGTEFPIEIYFIPLETDIGKFFLTYIIDISVSRQNQNIIKSQLIELQSKNQELEQFNYISSHDLQEPLRTVLNYLDMIEEDYPETNPEVQMHLSAVKNTVTRMSRIVKSLLEFGRLGRNKKLAMTDVGELINHVTEDLQNMIRESGTNIIVYGAMPRLYAYETELRQLFQNLISNAIKFRKAGTAPHIEIGCAKKMGRYRFYVSDNGIGIDPKYFDRIFNIFQRLNREEDYEGHGIGLANCKKIVEMHGGKIWVESQPGKGTTFIFTILNFTS
ncbi:MAG: ATP-binding protein [Flavobacterium sp.]